MIEFKADNLEKVDLYFSLAKAEEDIGNIKEAAENLIMGNKLKRKLIKYNINDETNQLLLSLHHNQQHLRVQNSIYPLRLSTLD